MNDLQQGIINKIGIWKSVFKDAVQIRTGQEIGDPTNLSYADILIKNGNGQMTFDDIACAVYDSITHVGPFSREQLAFLDTPGRRFVRQVADDIYRGYSREDFRLQASNDGPVIAIPHHVYEGTPLGAIFHHAGQFSMLEMYYATNQEQHITLPDTFYLGGAVFASIKAIRQLQDHPILKAGMVAQGIDMGLGVGIS